jgi:hypothetical protein
MRVAAGIAPDQGLLREAAIAKQELHIVAHAKGKP